MYYLGTFPLQVIAIVTDSLTDLDIFKDLQEACTRRNVPVYVLLDKTSVSAFLKMCNDISIRLEDLRVCQPCVHKVVFFCLPQDNWKPFNIFLYSFILPSNFFLLLFFFSFIQQMRVRSLSGTTYYLRSGASISGKIHERFMLIDGNRVATGSYR